ncbi:hypothetical protein [Mesoflavibacter sp. CH_XMU1404-2]|uniref:hypothetical protein n=1 Tax=Mesoflavibacter sp. CH_XMU1404-2 TaxID=3107766 RepID=UPI003008A5FF
MEEDFKFDLSVFSVSELKMLINIKSKKEFNNEEISFLNKFKKEHERQEKEYYDNSELERRAKLKKGNSITDDRIDLMEKHSIKTLISDLLKYENRNKYISEQKGLINKKFIDRLKKYFQLIDNGLLESSAEEIKQYKDISDLFIKSIDKKVIENYNKGIEVKKTFLPFLYLNEYV